MTGNRRLQQKRERQSVYSQNAQRASVRTHKLRVDATGKWYNVTSVYHTSSINVVNCSQEPDFVIAANTHLKLGRPLIELNAGRLLDCQAVQCVGDALHCSETELDKD